MYRKDNELHIIKFNNGNIIEKIYYFKDLEKLKSIAYGYKEYKDRVFNSINKQELVTASFKELLNNIEKDIEDKIINYLADTPDEEDLRIIDGHIASLDEDLSRSLKLEKF